MMECKRCEIIYHNDKKTSCDLCRGSLQKSVNNIYPVEAKGW